MRREITFLPAVFSILFLNSCAVPAALITGSGSLYVLHKEAKTHYPDKIPDFPSFSNIFMSSADHNALKSSADINHEFGFDCTKGKYGKNQSECFNRFVKSLSKKSNNNNVHQKKLSSKVTPSKVTPSKVTPSKVTPNVESSQYLKKSKIIKDQQVSQVIRVNPKAFQSKNRSQESISTETKSNQSREFVYSYFLKWINAWEQKDINSYMSFYSKEFVGTQKSRVGWEAHRHRALKTNSNIAIQIRNIQLHQSEEIIEINFTQRFKSDRYSDIGIKELIWAKNEGTWRIIKETWMPNEETLRVKKTSNSKNFISSQLLNWIDAWGSQNINLYISFYSKNFMGTKRSRLEWEAYRHRALKTNSNITIQVSNIHLHQNEETIEVNFKQRFKSDHYSDVGIKELVWRKTGSGWKILKETWIPS